MRNELVNNLGQPFFQWEFDAQNNWLYLNWIGYISRENGRKALNVFLQEMEANHYSYVLNDNRQLKGPWGAGQEGNTWMREHLFPKAMAAGLRYFAHVMAPGIAGALMAQDLHQRLNGSLQIHLFGEAEKATDWLRAMQTSDPAG